MNSLFWRIPYWVDRNSLLGIPYREDRKNVFWPTQRLKRTTSHVWHNYCFPQEAQHSKDRTEANSYIDEMLKLAVDHSSVHMSTLLTYSVWCRKHQNNAGVAMANNNHYRNYERLLGPNHTLFKIKPSSGELESWLGEAVMTRGADSSSGNIL